MVNVEFGVPSIFRDEETGIVSSDRHDGSAARSVEPCTIPELDEDPAP